MPLCWGHKFNPIARRTVLHRVLAILSAIELNNARKNSIDSDQTSFFSFISSLAGLYFVHNCHNV